jgi:hypothetical protein
MRKAKPLPSWCILIYLWLVLNKLLNNHPSSVTYLDFLVGSLSHATDLMMWYSCYLAK